MGIWAGRLYRRACWDHHLPACGRQDFTSSASSCVGYQQMACFGYMQFQQPFSIKQWWKYGGFFYIRIWIDAHKLLRKWFGGCWLCAGSWKHSIGFLYVHVPQKTSFWYCPLHNFLLPWIFYETIKLNLIKFTCFSAVTYTQSHRGGATIFGWTVDRALISTIFFVELSLVLFVLGKTITFSFTSSTKWQVRDPGKSFAYNYTVKGPAWLSVTRP